MQSAVEAEAPLSASGRTRAGASAGASVTHSRVVRPMKVISAFQSKR